jgi:hypothetical protein
MDDSEVRGVTFRAKARQIELARERAHAEGTTLGDEFRRWLEGYARPQQAKRASTLIEELRGYVRTGGRKFTREEMNERR